MHAVNKFLKSTEPNLEVGFSSFAFGKHACCVYQILTVGLVLEQWKTHVNRLLFGHCRSFSYRKMRLFRTISQFAKKSHSRTLLCCRRNLSDIEKLTQLSIFKFQNGDN